MHSAFSLSVILIYFSGKMWEKRYFIFGNVVIFFCPKSCEDSKSGLIFVILLFLGFVMSLSFFPSFSNHPIVIAWPANQSRNSNVLSRPEENTTLLAPSTVCNPNLVSFSNATNNDPDLELLVIIFSAVSNFQERQAIRDSWASEFRC